MGTKKLPGIPDNKNILYTIETLFDPNRVLNAYIEHSFSIGYHEHTFYEINIVVAGEGTHYMGRTVHRAKKYEVFIIPPNNPHAYISKGEFDVYHLIFRNSFLSKHILSLQALPGYNQLFNNRELTGDNTEIKHFTLDTTDFDMIVSELNNASHIIQRDINSALVAECHAIIVLAKLCEKYNETLQSRSGNDKRALFRKSVDFIYNNYRESISVDELGKISGLSRSAYTKKFIELYGISPKQFIIQERIKAAKSLLTGSTMPICEIAECIGFYDVSHFVKTFFSIVGEKPLAYRNNHRA